MKSYVAKLIAPRPTFMHDATPEEIGIMRTHLGYWTEQMKEKRVAAFGPVDDPQGGYGLAILTLPDDAVPQAITDQDPAILAKIGFRYEIAPMPRLILPSA